MVVMMFWARRLDQCLIAEINFPVLSLDTYGLNSWIGTMSYAHATISENYTDCALFFLFLGLIHLIWKFKFYPFFKSYQTAFFKRELSKERRKTDDSRQGSEKKGNRIRAYFILHAINIRKCVVISFSFQLLAIFLENIAQVSLWARSS